MLKTKWSVNLSMNEGNKNISNGNPIQNDSTEDSFKEDKITEPSKSQEVINSIKGSIHSFNDLPGFKITLILILAIITLMIFGMLIGYILVAMNLLKI